VQAGSLCLACHDGLLHRHKLYYESVSCDALYTLLMGIFQQRMLIVANRPTRTLSEPDGICSSGVGQHPATALAPPLGRKTPYPRMWRTELESVTLPRVAD